MNVFSLKKTEPLCSGHLAIADKFSRNRRCPLYIGSIVKKTEKNSLHDCSTAVGTIVQQSLVQLFSSHWYNSLTVTGIIFQHLLTRLFNCRLHDCSAVNGTIVQQSLAQFFNSQEHNSSTVTGMIP